MGAVSRNRRHVTSACTPCRVAKTKCDGEFPCEPCCNKNRKCHYRKEPDARTVQRRRYQELDLKNERFNTVVKWLENGTTKSSEQILEFLRGDRIVVDESQHHGKSSRKRPRQGVMSVESLIDQPLFQVQAVPWTTVIDDDDAASHLLSAYLTWPHSMYPIIDPEIFVREMQSEDLSSLYCSRFLVNAIFGLACMFTDHSAVFAENGDSSSRARHFFKEAGDLWQIEEGNSTLTNLQGLVVFVVCAAFLGQDRVALLYGSQLGVLRSKLHSQIRRAQKTKLQEYTSEEFLRSWRLAAWSSFKIEVDMSMAWKTPLSISKPVVARPYQGEELNFHAHWRPYPETEPLISYNPRMTCDAGFSLYEIGAEICSIMLSGKPEDSPLPGHIILEPLDKLAKAQGIEHNLLTWQHEFPLASMTINEGMYPRLAGPVTELLLTYNNWRIEVNSIVFNEPIASRADRTNASQNIINACRSVAELLQYIQNNFGEFSFTGHVLHTASLCAHNLIGYLEEPEIPDIFHTVITTLAAICCRITLARGITRSLWMTIKERKSEERLRNPTIELLKLNAVDKWKPKDQQLLVSCTYPNYATSSTNGRDLHTIGELLASYARLDIHQESH